MRLHVHDLALDRGGRRLFEGLSFELRPGQALALTGPNGAGKTSLLRAVAGLLRPMEGRVRFTNEAGDLSTAEARAALHWLGAADGLSGTRCAEAELRFWTAWAAPQAGVPLPLGGDAAPPGRDSVGASLHTLGLADQARTEVRRLSTGQRRRLALARLLAQPRALWLLDEPLAPLDPHWRARVGGLMQAHLDGGGLLIAAVHDALPVAARELRLEAA